MKPKWFKLEELLPKSFYRKWYPIYRDKLWLLFDDRVLDTQDALRDIYGKMVCNTWLWGGNHQYRGWRPWNCRVGAKLSQHKSGRANDSVFIDVDTSQVRQDIINDIHPYAFRHITAVEISVPWLHFDCRDHDKGLLGVLQIKP